ncbi:uncharacterized protein [Centruroides vittatus]|uniref:uncharacterized protein n=1 Tax=Centruroides vittatus TaxID=120091 RepID=UPI00350FB0D4
MGLENIFILGILLSACVIIITVSLFLASLITQSAFKPYYELCRIISSSYTFEDQVKLYHLLSIINNETVGLNWMGIFIISKGSILKVIGFLISIYIFLLQWKQLMSNNKQCNENCTENCG